MTDYVAKAKQLEAELSASDDENARARAPSRRRRATRRSLAAASSGASASASLADEPIVKKALTNSGANAILKPKLECAFCRARFSQRVAPLFREHLQTCVLKQVERSREFLDASIVDLVRSKYASVTRRKPKRKQPLALASRNIASNSNSNSVPSCSGLSESQAKRDGLKLSTYFANARSEGGDEDPVGERELEDGDGESAEEEEEEEDETVCAFCARSMATWSVERRAVHADRCAAADERAARAELTLRDSLVDAAQRATLACPLCDAPAKSTAQRKAHIKRCAAQHHVPFDHLLVLMRNQERAFIARLNQLGGRSDVNGNGNGGSGNGDADPQASALPGNEPGPSMSNAHEQRARLRIAELIRLLDENRVPHKAVEQDPVTNRYRLVPKVKPKAKPKPNLSGVVKQEAVDASANADADANATSAQSNRTAVAEHVAAATSTPQPQPHAQAQAQLKLSAASPQLSTSLNAASAALVGSHVAEPTQKPMPAMIIAAPAPTTSAPRTGSQRSLVQTVLSTTGASTNANANANARSSSARAAYRALVREESNKLRMMSRLEQLLLWNTKPAPTAVDAVVEADFQPTIVTLSVKATADVDGTSTSASVLDRLDVSVAAESDSLSLWQLASLAGRAPPDGWFASLPCFVPFTMLDPDRIPGRWNDAKLADIRRRKREREAERAKQTAASLASTSTATATSTSEQKRTCASDCVLFGTRHVTPIASPFVTLARHFARLLDDVASADAKIVVVGAAGVGAAAAGSTDGERETVIALHSAVLAARCTPLLERVSAAADLTWRVDAAAQRIEPAAMRAFVEYVYSAHECPILSASSTLLEQFYRIAELVHMDEFETLLNRRISLDDVELLAPSTAAQSRPPLTVQVHAHVTGERSAAKTASERKPMRVATRGIEQPAKAIETDSAATTSRLREAHAARFASPSAVSITPLINRTFPSPSAPPSGTEAQPESQFQHPWSTQSVHHDIEDSTPVATEISTLAQLANCTDEREHEQPTVQAQAQAQAQARLSLSCILSSDSEDDWRGASSDSKRDTVFTQKVEPIVHQTPSKSPSKPIVQQSPSKPIVHQSPSTSTSPSKRDVDVSLPSRESARLGVTAGRSAADLTNADSPIIIDSDSDEEAKAKVKRETQTCSRLSRRSCGTRSASNVSVSVDVDVNLKLQLSATAASTQRRSACERPRAYASPSQCYSSQPSTYDPVPTDLPSVLDVTYFERADRPTPTPSTSITPTPALTRNGLRESLLRSGVERCMPIRSRTKTDTETGTETDRTRESESHSPVFTKRRKKTNSCNQRLVKSDDCASSIDVHAESASAVSRSLQPQPHRHSCSQPIAGARSNECDDQLLHLPCHGDDNLPALTAPQSVYGKRPAAADRLAVRISDRTDACASGARLATSALSASGVAQAETVRAKANLNSNAVAKRNCQQQDSDDELPPPFSQVVRQMLEQVDVHAGDCVTAKQQRAATSDCTHELDDVIALAELSHPSALFADWDADPDPDADPSPRCTSPATQPRAAMIPTARHDTLAAESDSECETQTRIQKQKRNTQVSPPDTPCGRAADVSNYSAMDTPGLHKELARYGLKRLARRKAVLVLRDIRSRMRHSAQRHVCARRSVEKAARTLHKAAAAHTLTPAGAAPRPPRPQSISRHRSNRVLFAPAPTDDGECAQSRRRVLEESIMFASRSDDEDDDEDEEEDEEEEDESADDGSRERPCSQAAPRKQRAPTNAAKRCDSQSNATRKRKRPETERTKATSGGGKTAKRRKPKSELIREAMLDCFRNDETFYLRILAYEPIAIEEFQERLRAADIRCGEQRLINVLDEQCVTFSLRNQNSFLHRNRDAAKRNAHAKPTDGHSQR